MTRIHQPHDKYFKANLKYKRVAIDFLKTYLEPELFSKIDINSLQLTEKSFILPRLREIHSDVIYKCVLNNSLAYLFFLLEHQSTADSLMAFRFSHAIDTLSHEHLKQGYKKIPVVLPFCIYHGEPSPYPYSNCLYDCYDDSEFAKKVTLKAFKFKLIDLTVLSDEEIETHGLVGLMEMLFKHQRDRNFLASMRKMLKSQFIQNVIRQLDISYLNDMLNYILATAQDETDSQADKYLISELIGAFPEGKDIIMTFAQQIERRGLQQGLQQGEHRKAIIIAKNMLAEGMSPKSVQKLTGLSENEIINLVHKH